MSIQDQINPQAIPGSFAAAGSAAPAQQQAAAPMRSAGFSLLNMGNVGGLVRSSTSEALAKGFTAVEQAIKESRISAAYKVHGVQVDNEADRRLLLASIVLAIRHEASGFVAHHTLLLEASADPIPSKVEVINQTQVTIDRFAAQAYDAKYSEAVEATIQAAFPGQTILNTGATVVPRIFDWTDREATRELVQNAMMAAVTYLEARQPGFIDMDMSQITNDSNMQVQLSFDNPEITDYTGLPVRADINVVCSAVANQRVESGSLNGQTEAVPVSRVTGYIDLTYFPNQNPMQGYGQPVIGASRIYQPRLVLTKMEHMLRLTPAAQLFALATASVLGEGTNFYRAFKPKQKFSTEKGQKDFIDPHDIGAVNIEANLEKNPSGVGVKTDTRAASFDDRQLGILIQATMHPGLAISVDVNDCGADTWFNRPLAAASTGDPAANAELLRAANTLTGGHFARLYGNSNFNAVLVTDERVLMGYYVGPDGRRTDVREIDYLAVMNLLGTTNPQAIVDWSETIEMIQTSQALRLQGRRTIIRNLCEQLTFTQIATRVTMNPEFMKMLVQALKECGVGLKLVNNGMSADYLSQRAGGLLGQAAMGYGPSGLFNQGGFSGQAATVFQRPYQGQPMF